MGTDAGLRVVGTIRTIELHTLTARFEHVTSRQVAKIELDIERAQGEEGEDRRREPRRPRVSGSGRALPRFSAGDRVQIETSADSGLNITSIKPAPLS